MASTVACAGLAAAGPRTRPSSSGSGMQGLRASLRAAQARAGRRPLCVQANELNKWADRSNYDEHNDEDWENSQFDRETAALVLKVLTAKATQRLLLQLQELDGFKAQWLTNYCSEHPPSESKFLLGLLRQKATTVLDASTATTHTIDPANLAHRIVQIRSEMAATMLKFPKYVEVQTTEVLRQHLMSSTYVSGTSTAGAKGGDYKERRGYYRRR
ncbi:hypothetical protein ABPG75_011496 [Micractinium tetrahymenae]